MYTVAPYFLANTCSNITTYVIYPILVSFLTFFWFKYPESDFGGFMLFFMIELVAAVMGLCYGQLIGSIVYTEYFALLTLMQTITIYYLGAGILINAQEANWLASFFQWISPMRYANELAFRRILAGRDENFVNETLEQLGYTWGPTLCASLCFVYMIGALSTGMILMVYRNRGA